MYAHMNIRPEFQKKIAPKIAAKISNVTGMKDGKR
jgi:hypothetical protein